MYWFFLGIMAYLSFAISTSIDKLMMNKSYDPLDTSIYKLFFDGLILLIVGFLAFNQSITVNTILAGSLIGLLYGLSSVLYFKMLTYLDSQVAIPTSQSSSILLVAILAVPLFNESLSVINIIGIFIVIVGVYLVLDGRLRVPKKREGFRFLFAVVLIGVTHTLLTKQFLTGIKPITLSTILYLSSTGFLTFYKLLKTEQDSSVVKLFNRNEIITIFMAAIFGALGTILLFTSIMIGDVSKVYTLSGAQSAFIFIISVLFLDESASFKRGLGVIIVFLGISIVSI